MFTIIIIIIIGNAYKEMTKDDIEIAYWPRSLMSRKFRNPIDVVLQAQRSIEATR